MRLLTHVIAFNLLYRSSDQVPNDALIHVQQFPSVLVTLFIRISLPVFRIRLEIVHSNHEVEAELYVYSNHTSGNVYQRCVYTI